MNWNALGAIAELLGAIGVVATLVYLALQIRQNSVHLENTNRSMREAALLAARAMTTEFNTLVVADAAVARIYRLGLGASPKLEADDRVRFDMLMAKWLLDVETLHLLHQRGSFEPNQWAIFEARLTMLLATPGGRASWLRLAGTVGEEFRQFVEAELLASDRPVDHGPSQGVEGSAS